jgi:hypothetical protein
MLSGSEQSRKIIFSEFYLTASSVKPPIAQNGVSSTHVFFANK